MYAGVLMEQEWEFQLFVRNDWGRERPECTWASQVNHGVAIKWFQGKNYQIYTIHISVKATGLEKH